MFKLLSLVIAPLIVAGLIATVTNLIQHGNVLGQIQVAVQDLKEGQVRIEASVGARIGQIVNVQSEEQREIAAIQEAMRGERERMLPLRVSPN